MVAKRRKTVGKSKQPGVGRNPRYLELRPFHAGAVRGGDKVTSNDFAIVKKIDKATP
jgi:hypothetical protein